MKYFSPSSRWWTNKELVHQFYPYGHDPCRIPAVASLGGLEMDSTRQRQKLQVVLDCLITPDPKLLGITSLVCDSIDVEGHPANLQRLRRYSLKMLQAVNEGINRMQTQGIIEPS